MKIPPDIADMIKTENRRMDAVLSDWGYHYEGPNLWTDAKKIRKESILDLGDLDTDPFEDLGHGVVSYFRMIEVMACFFFIMTFLFIPVFYFYSQGHGYDILKGSSYHLGNLGEA